MKTSSFTNIKAMYFSIQFGIKSIFWSKLSISCIKRWSSSSLRLWNMTVFRFSINQSNSFTELASEPLYFFCHVPMISYYNILLIIRFTACLIFQVTWKFILSYFCHDESKPLERDLKECYSNQEISIFRCCSLSR